ncbi:hypothetical protein [Magnetococcus sp. PR-3]|uniref:hypothetical protein n=1 Tax=Magnetococcus sp. PR-3 TaxID=3120355 RepID=UPI002FCE3EAD
MDNCAQPKHTNSAPISIFFPHPRGEFPSFCGRGCGKLLKKQANHLFLKGRELFACFLITLQKRGKILFFHIFSTSFPHLFHSYPQAVDKAVDKVLEAGGFPPESAATSFYFNLFIATR